MADNEFKKIRDKIVEGMKISAEKLLAKKKLLGQKLVISENGIIQIIEAREIK
jgi:hypothetical protein